MSSKPSFISIELGSDFIRWGAGFEERQVIKTIPISENMFSRISPQNKYAVLTKDILTYIRDREGYDLPSVCTITVPYLTFREFIQTERAVQEMGIPYQRIMKRISSFAYAVSRLGPECEEDEFALLIDYNNTSCETAVVQMGSGVTEMCSIVQRRIDTGTPMTPELLRKDIFKAIDLFAAQKIVGTYVSDSLPAEYRKMLKDSFHLECTRMPPDSVLTGSMIQGGIIAGTIRDALLLDATDYEICVGQKILLNGCTTIPVKGSVEIPYRSTRPDQCIDIIIKKNNMVTDEPQCFKLPVKPLLNPGQDEHMLRVTADISSQGKLSFLIECTQNGKKNEYEWEEIRNKLQ